MLIEFGGGNDRLEGQGLVKRERLPDRVIH